MVDLVKIRKKAKKKAEDNEALSQEPAPSASVQAEEGASAPASAPAEQASSGPPPHGDELLRAATESRQEAAAEKAPRQASAPEQQGARAAAAPSTTKLDRFREQAGRLRDAINAAPAAQGTATDGSVLEVLSFVIGNEHYAADIEKIVEIVTPRTVTRVPNSDPSIVGIVSLRGMMVTIVDVTARLRQKRHAQTADTRFVVVDLGGETLGFEVDRVLRVLKLDRGSVEPHPVIHSSEVDDSIVGVFRHEGTLTILLDFDKLLAATAIGSS